LKKRKGPMSYNRAFKERYMMTASYSYYSSSKSIKFAKKNDLFSISFTIFNADGLEKLSPRGRRWLHYFVSVAKLGFSGIDAPMGAIIDSERGSNGQTISRATAYRSLAELQNAGFITRPNRKNYQKIIFNMENLACFLRNKKHANSEKAPQTIYIDDRDILSYTNLHVSTCDTLDRTNIASSNTDLVVTRPRASARCNKNTKNIKNRKLPGPLYSLFVALGKRNKKFSKKSLMENYFRHISQFVSWERRWEDISSFSVRENLAILEVWPILEKLEQIAPGPNIDVGQIWSTNPDTLYKAPEYKKCHIEAAESGILSQKEYEILKHAMEMAARRNAS